MRPGTIVMLVESLEIDNLEKGKFAIVDKDHSRGDGMMSCSLRGQPEYPTYLHSQLKVIEKEDLVSSVNDIAELFLPESGDEDVNDINYLKGFNDGIELALSRLQQRMPKEHGDMEDGC